MPFFTFGLLAVSTEHGVYRTDRFAELYTFVFIAVIGFVYVLSRTVSKEDMGLSMACGMGWFLGSQEFIKRKTPAKPIEVRYAKVEEEKVKG